MFFEENKSIAKAGEIIGYTLSYLLFTLVLFFILKLFDKLPLNWSFVHLGGITALISLIGIIIQRALK